LVDRRAEPATRSGEIRIRLEKRRTSFDALPAAVPQDDVFF
jgi:hypothetical protein